MFLLFKIIGCIFLLLSLIFVILYFIFEFDFLHFLFILFLGVGFGFGLVPFLLTLPDELVCPVCDIEINSEYCHDCGTKGVLKGDLIYVCLGCGKEYRSPFDFCGTCGSPSVIFSDPEVP